MCNKKGALVTKGRNKYILCKIWWFAFTLISLQLLERENLKAYINEINWMTIILGDSVLVATMFPLFSLYFLIYTFRSLCSFFKAIWAY